MSRNASHTRRTSGLSKVLAGLAATGILFAAAAPASASSLYLGRAQAVQSVRISSQRWLGETPTLIRCHRHSAREFYCHITVRGSLHGALDRRASCHGCAIVTRLRGIDVLQLGHVVLVRPLRHHFGIAIRLDYAGTATGNGVATGQG